MKNIVLWVIAILFVATATTYYFNLGEKLNKKFEELISYSPCATPLRYKIGDIDKRFKMTDKTLLKNIQEAEKVWEEIDGKELFVYDPDNKPDTEKDHLITINMVYDSRQGLNTQIGQLEKTVKSGANKFDTSRIEYEAKVTSFNARSEELNRKIKELSIDDPQYKQKFDEVWRESEALNEEAKSLNQMAESLNLNAQEHNKKVNQLNQTISNFNDEIAKRPEEGLYIPETYTIEIYLVNSNPELIHTLAHELGHARGIDHNENPKAIMNPLTSEALKPTDDDINSLKEICRVRTIFDD